MVALPLFYFQFTKFLSADSFCLATLSRIERFGFQVSDFSVQVTDDQNTDGKSYSSDSLLDTYSK